MTTTLDDLINNDARILDRSRHTHADGRTYLTFDFGDGKPLKGEFPEQLDGTLRKSWCDTVRRVWNERKDSQAAKVPSKEDPVQGSHKRDDPPANEPRGGSVSVPASVQAIKAEMEESLRAKIAGVDRALTAASTLVSQLEVQLEDATLKVSSLCEVKDFLEEEIRELTSKDS